MKLHFNDLAGSIAESDPPASGVSPGEVHVWSHKLRSEDSFYAHATRMLSEAELDKANRYHFEKDKKLYMAGHVFARNVIAHYTSLEPNELRFAQTGNMKPHLVDSPINIKFNLTHSEELVLIAVGFDNDVGIDTEFIMDNFDTDGFAESNFHENELSEFRKLKGDEQADLFYKIWTRKEAFLKLTGEGINDHLKDIDFSGSKASIKYSSGAPRNLWLCTWKRKDNYICSLASDKSEPKIRFFESTLVESLLNEDF
jgi:4'-phosphopantetheinyl transferase